LTTSRLLPRIGLPMTTPDTSSDPAIGGPVGHRCARATILRQLKRDGSATVAELASGLASSLNTARHHLRELEADGSVSHERTLHGVGAPVFSYRLSPQGHSLFPDRYAGTVTHLLDHLTESQGRVASVAVLEAHFGRLGARLAEATRAVPPVERGEMIARLLEAEGFMASWEPSADGGTLTEHNCPHRVVAERFPELCLAEEAFLAQAFGGSVERRSRIAEGCGCCRYRITLPTTLPEDAA
jgi:DeoR family suf operon transcriptional repressor